MLFGLGRTGCLRFDLEWCYWLCYMVGLAVGGLGGAAVGGLGVSRWWLGCCVWFLSGGFGWFEALLRGFLGLELWLGYWSFRLSWFAVEPADFAFPLG